MSRQSRAGELPAPYEAVIDLAAVGAQDRQLAALAPQVAGWFSSPAQGVVFEADRVVGAQDISLSLASLGPKKVEVLGSVLAGRLWWGELTLSGDREPETCLVSVTRDHQHQVSEVVWLRADIVPPGASGSGRCSQDARRMLEAYFEDLQASRFHHAASWFASDGIYSHPPYRPGGARVLWHGRDAIRDGFTNERGESPVRQIITDVAQDGSRAFIRGIVEGVANGGGGSFVSTAQFSDSGEIARYVAFYSAVRF